MGYKISKIFLNLMLLIFFLLGGIGKTVSASNWAAQLADPTCQPLDIIFVVENSSDMAAADPESYRFDLIKNIAEFLGYDYLFHCDGLAHRIAIISFDGSHAEIDLDFTPLSPVPFQSKESWTEDVEAKLSGFVRRNEWNGRNFLLAFELVEELLQEEDFSTGVERKQMVFVLTSVYGASETEEIEFIPVNVERNLLEFNQELANWEYDMTMGPFLNVFSFENGPEQYKERSIDAWKTIVANFKGEFDLVSADKPFEIGYKILQAILKQTDAGADRLLPALNCPEIFVEPMTDGMALFVLSNNQSTDAAFINTESGTMIRIRETYDEINPVVLIDAPIPGKWKLESNKCGEIFAVSTSTFFEPQISSNVYQNHQENQCDKSKFGECQPPDLEIELIESSGDKIPIFTDYSPRLSGKITTPTGQDIPLVFDFDETANIFRSTDPIKASDFGPHTISLAISIESITPETVSQEIVLGSEEIEYDVIQVIPFDLTIISPQKDQSFELYSEISTGLIPQSLEIVVKIVAEGGGELLNVDEKPVYVDELFDGDLFHLVEAELIHKRSDQMETIWLEPLESNPYVFAGKMGLKLSEIGDYTAHIKLSDDFRESISLGYDVLGSERTVEISRTCSPLNCPYTVQVARYAAIVTGILLIGFFIYAFTLPVHGALEFYVPGECNPIFIAQLPLRRGLPIRWINLQGRTIRRNSPVISFIHKVRGMMKGRNAISIKLFDEKGKKIFSKNKMIANEELEKLPHGMQFRYVQTSLMQNSQNEEEVFENEENEA
jgi:hypothetical protein